MKYEKHIMVLVERLVTDADLTDEKAKVVSLLKEACLVLHPTEERNAE